MVARFVRLNRQRPSGRAVFQPSLAAVSQRLFMTKRGAVKG